MALTRALAENIFASLATKDYAFFFTHVSPAVDWILPPEDVHIPNPVAGHYHSVRDFAMAISPLSKCMQNGGILSNWLQSRSILNSAVLRSI